MTDRHTDSYSSELLAELAWHSLSFHVGLRKLHGMWG